MSGTGPRIVNAQALSPRLVRIAFDRDIAAAGIPSFNCQALDYPAVPLSAVAAQIDGPLLDLTLDTEMTPLVHYRLVVSGIVDGDGRPAESPGNRVEWTGFRPQRPVDRQFDLWSMLSKHNRRSDTTGDLRLFIASWTGSEWTRDDSAAHSGGFRFSGSFFEFLHDSGGAATFGDWANTWRLPMADTINSGLEVTGTIREYGRLALYGTNSYSATRTIALGGAVTFRARFPSAPSSITIAPSNTSSNWQGQVSVWTSSRDGFGFYSYQNLTATAHAWWHGSYTAIA